MSINTEGLTIAGKTYNSRLLVGSGKYKDLEQTRLATEASGADIITVAIRRVNIGQDPNAPSLLDVVPPLPDTPYVAMHLADQRSNLLAAIVMLAQACCDFSRLFQDATPHGTVLEHSPFVTSRAEG